MKALFLHCNEWRSRPESSSERIGDCQPDELAPVLLEAQNWGGPEVRPAYISRECLVIFFQVEVGDGEKQAKILFKDILKIAKKVGTTRLVVECFAHLSHSRPDPTVAKNLVKNVLETCGGFEGYEVKTSPFGWNKGLVLDVKGHPDAFKHRSY